MLQPPHTIFLSNVLHFMAALRAAGIPVSVEQSAEFTQALELIDISSRDQFYYAARTLLLNRYENLRLFDTIFNRFWRVQSRPNQGQKMPVAPRHNVEKRPQFNIVNYMAFKAKYINQELDIADKAGTFSNAELLNRKQFSEMTPEELENIKRILMRMAWPAILRTSRRKLPSKQGKQYDLRRSFRDATKHNGVPIQLSMQTHKIKQRPIVLLADISGSMEKYARLMLQFFFCISRNFDQTEAFLFGTRLTRITNQLKLKNIDRAIQDAAKEVIDWAGGTRIGDSLRAFNQQWARRVVRRGAIVIIVSDGWERGDTTVLTKEMRYLHHRCHRLMWLNPLAGSTTYQPAAEGMTAALPHIDDFLPIHNLQSLEQLAQHLKHANNRGQRRGTPQYYLPFANGSQRTPPQST